MTAYYNEFDPFAAAWLRNLIAAGHIAPGDVDERDLWDVPPDDLKPYTQVHLCAGIGVWSYALRRAGWRDDEPVWTASFPCQPFSQAGKGEGVADARHLWPAGFHLIQQCDPAIVLGEQVASKDGLFWLDLVRFDLEGTGRSFAAADLCAAGVGAPHIRQRSFWMAHTKHDDRRADQSGRGSDQRTVDGGSGRALRMAHTDVAGSQGWAGVPERTNQRVARQVGVAVGLGDTRSAGLEKRRRVHSGHRQGQFAVGASSASETARAGPVNGFWSDADWLACRDGKWRPVEPGTFPLAHGAANRVGRLRGYGNAIVAPVAETFIAAAIEARKITALLT